MRRLLPPALAALASLALLARGGGAEGPRLPSPAEPRKLSGTTEVTCNSTVGTIRIQVHPDWAPIGAARFLQLVRCGFYDGCALFRAIPGFLVQFGISPDYGDNQAWRAEGPVGDDPLRPDVPIKRGTLAFAGSGPGSRTTQVFIAFGDNTGLGKRPWEVPFAQVEDASLPLLADIETKYGDTVQQAKLQGRSGYDYLRTNFPGLTYLTACRAPPSPAGRLCPKWSGGGSVADVVEAVREAPGRLAERLQLPVPLVLLLLVAVPACIVLLLCTQCRRPAPDPWAGPMGQPYPQAYPQYQLVMK